MELFRGLVIAERGAGDRGKFIDVLTEKNTVQELYVRGAKKPGSAGTSTTQLFAYARFSVNQRNQRLYLDSAQPIRLFYHLRDSLSRLSLAMYFSELIRLSVREYKNPGERCEVLRLMLNTLHFLENGSREEALLKPIFELRLMTELGMMPDLLTCRRCGVFLPERLYFVVEEGCFYCTSCTLPYQAERPVLLCAPSLQAMRHIVFADFDRLFHFRLGASHLAAVSECTERFVQYHLDFRLKALEFYHDMIQNDTKTIGGIPDESEPPDTGVS